MRDRTPRWPAISVPLPSATFQNLIVLSSAGRDDLISLRREHRLADRTLDGRQRCQSSDEVQSRASLSGAARDDAPGIDESNAVDRPVVRQRFEQLAIEFVDSYCQLVSAGDDDPRVIGRPVRSGRHRRRAGSRLTSLPVGDVPYALTTLSPTSPRAGCHRH